MRQYKPRRYAKAKRVANYRRFVAGKRRFRATKTSKGFLCVKRKHPELYVRNSAVAGVAQLIDPTGTCLLLGAPIADGGGAGTYSIPFSMTFRLDQVINSTDITNLCDAYKLKYVQIGLTYQSTQSSVGGLQIMPNLTWVQDHDDSSVPTSINQLREKMDSKFKTFGFNKLLKIGVQPRVADTVFNNGITSAYSQAKPLWLDSNSPGVEHYSIKGIIGNVNLSSSATVSSYFKFDVTTTVYGKDFQ